MESSLTSTTTTSSSSRKRKASLSLEKEEEEELKINKIAEHYNKVAKEIGDINSRAESPVIQLRCFNNWVKAMMILKNVKRGDEILEIGCGRGGDLSKYQRAGIKSLYGFDIAESALKEAEERYYEMRGRKFLAFFKKLDCFYNSIIENLPKDLIRFDLVSAQFCIHYAFESEEKVCKMLKNVTCKLKKGGIFMGTAPNSNWLVKKAKNIGKNEFGNKFYSVKFDKIDEIDIYGQRYKFSLFGAVEDCPEYLIHWPTFISLAAKYDLKVFQIIGFHDFYKQENELNRQILLNMKVLSYNKPKMSEEEWEIAGLYNVFIFSKI